MTFSTIASLGVSLQGGGGSGGGGAASLPISGNGATVTASTPLVDGTQTWNNAAVTFTSFKLNITDTASAAASLLMDLQVGGTSRFRFRKDGLAFFTNDIYLQNSAQTTNYALLSSTGFTQSSTQFIAWGNTNTNITGADTILSRRGAANLRFGAADAAAPVAQTLSVQSVVAGTTNTAGANLTITGSQGTGTGAGGSIIFQVAPAGSSGSAQNALAAALTINADRTLSPGGSASVFIRGSSNFLEFANTLNASFLFYGTSANFASGDDAVSINPASSRFVVRSGGGFAWSSVATYSNTTPDLILLRDADNTLAQRNGTNAQESRVYGSYTSATNFQRMSIKTLRESSGALSGATYVTTIAIPAYANLIGVTTRVTTAVTGATTYDVGDGTDVDLWGAAIGVALGSQSRTADFTAVAAVGAAATSRTVTLTANGSNFTGGVVEICLHYLTTEAD